MNKYFISIWTNTGDWNGIRHYAYTFEIENDAEAQEIARSLLAEHKSHKGDIFLSEFIKIEARPGPTVELDSEMPGEMLSEKRKKYIGLCEVHQNSVIEHLVPFSAEERATRQKRKVEQERERLALEQQVQSMPVPKEGDLLYVLTELYLSHGVDDFLGGLATVASVKEGKSGGRTVHYIEVKERPGHQYNWEDYLAEDQDRLRAEHGSTCACRDPDFRSQFNEG